MKVTSKDLSRLLTIMIVSKILFSDINIFVKNSGSAAYMEAVLCALSGIVIFLAISVDPTFFRRWNFRSANLRKV